MTILTLTTEIQVIGSASDPDTFFCQHVINRIMESGNDKSVTMKFIPSFESDYIVMLDSLRERYGAEISELMHHKDYHVVLRISKNGSPEYIGTITNLIEVAENEYEVKGAGLCNTVIFNRESREELYRQAVSIEAKRKIVYMEFEDMSPKQAIGLGNVFIELYEDICPQACKNFISLCTALTGDPSYRDCSIHRLVKDGWLQCGDVVDGSGKNSVAVEGFDKNGIICVPDESFAVHFGAARGGIIGYANSGPHSNGSQFFITLGSCDWMNNKFVGIGRVLQGWEYIRKLNQLETRNQVPTKKVSIVRCGLAMDLLSKKESK